VVAVVPFPLEVSVALFVEIIIDRKPEEKLVLLEGVTGLEACRYLRVVGSLIAGAQVHFVSEATSVVIPHVERVQHRVKTDVPLVVEAKMCPDTIENVVSDSIPQDVLGEVAFFLLGVCESRVASQGVFQALLSGKIQIRSLLLIA